MHSQRLDGTGRQLIGSIADDIRCIAYDWIGHNIVWSTVGQIGATSVANATLTKTLVYHTYAVSLALDPQNGRMFWCGWHPSSDVVYERTGTIGFAWMDGTRKGLLADNLQFPSSLTIDHGEQRLYWFDTDIVERIDLNGQHREVVMDLSRAGHSVLPFTLVYHARNLFFSDLQHKIIRLYMNNATTTTSGKSFESQ